MIVTITPAALTEINRLNSEKSRLRIKFKAGGCSGMTIAMDYTKLLPDEEFDLIFQFFLEDKSVLEVLIDVKSATYLDGATLDFGGTLLDRGFKWTFPKAKGGCGCGTSFSF